MGCQTKHWKPRHKDPGHCWARSQPVRGKQQVTESRLSGAVQPGVGVLPRAPGNLQDRWALARSTEARRPENLTQGEGDRLLQVTPGPLFTVRKKRDSPGLGPADSWSLLPEPQSLHPLGEGAGLGAPSAPSCSKGFKGSSCAALLARICLLSSPSSEDRGAGAAPSAVSCR